MEVKVAAPFKVYFSGSANSLSAENETGPFDILPHHKNFMTLLKPCSIKVRRDGKPDFILEITRGLIHVRNNKVTVFLDV